MLVSNRGAAFDALHLKNFKLAGSVVVVGNSYTYLPWMDALYCYKDLHMYMYQVLQIRVMEETRKTTNQKPLQSQLVVNEGFVSNNNGRWPYCFCTCDAWQLRKVKFFRFNQKFVNGQHNSLWHFSRNSAETRQGWKHRKTALLQ